ncbi:MAG: Na+/H+ antiporter NhaC family protein [Lachnospiraceae bacterium]|nr:Na+/H+ antiporter NhaC family protein [Lachnospiraceae bacterium]
MKSKKKIISGILIALVLIACSGVTAFAAEEGAEYVPSMYASFWALVPPIVAIVLALITKEVYSSLFIGIVIGGIFYSIGHWDLLIPQIFKEGVVGVLTDADNIAILVFVTLLGIMVCLMTRAGGSAAFGRWAGEHIKTRVGAQFATVCLGLLIFIDDGFNCLTVGSVMRPVTDEHKISRAKLAYIIDSTAAPICIIAPISSWAAAVTGFVPGEDGFSLFIRAIPYNYYALLTITMLIVLTLFKMDYGPMRKHEKNALAGDLFTTADRPYGDKEEEGDKKGGVVDLLVPILVLIGCCILGIVYTGGLFEGVPFIRAFSESEAAFGLMLGTFLALIITILFYAARKVLTLRESIGSCIPEGAKTMIPPMIILILAWTLKAMTVSLGASEFVANAVGSASGNLFNFLPAIIFVVGCFLAFSTGTSWGTFGILIPIVVAVFAGTDETMLVLAISACMAGAVCGDHCSPISDTTIMSSAGAQCSHVNHVSTQLPYAITVACVSFVTYIIAGFVKNAFICLPIGVALMLATLFIIRRVTAKDRIHTEESA